MAKPATLTTRQARAYVAQVLRTTLSADVDNSSEWMHEDLDEPSVRRVRKAIDFWIRKLERAGMR